MYVMTADQKDSRSGTDLVPSALELVVRTGGSHLAISPERTTGDEIQVATADAATVLALILELTRTERWSVGVGVGDIESENVPSIRAARGSAFVQAREAVDKAKRQPTRFAFEGSPAAHDAEALIRVLIDLRDRRTENGWDVYDLRAQGTTQQDIARQLGITPSAVSLRARAAGLATEEGAIEPLVRLIERS